MPTMPRMNNKETKIAYKILGIPSNLASKKDTEAKRINKQLVFEETIRSR
jgi:hypothetical protein